MKHLTISREGAAVYPFKRARLTAADVLPDIPNKSGNSAGQPEATAAPHGSARQDSGKTKIFTIEDEPLLPSTSHYSKILQ